MAQRMSPLYGKATRLDSHINRVVSSLGLIASSKRLSRKEIFVRRSISAFAIFLLISYGLSPLFVNADTVTFYPAACLGGWSNVHMAENETETKGGEVDFSLNNSAALAKETVADLYCGSFSAEIPIETSPQKISLSIMWKALTPDESSPLVSNSFASSTLEILDATSTVDFTLDTSTTTELEISETAEDVSTETAEASVGTGDQQTDSNASETTTEVVAEPQAASSDSGLSPEDVLPTASVEASVSESITDTPSTPQALETVVSPATEPAPAPTVDPVVDSAQSFVSPLKYFVALLIPTVHAQEDGTPTEATSSPENLVTETTSNAATSTEETEDQKGGVLFEISYTLDGENWLLVKSISAADIYNFETNLPIELAGGWSSFSNIQIKIHGLSSIDEKPTVLVDGMFLTTTYSEKETLIEENNVVPESLDVENAQIETEDVPSPGEEVDEEEEVEEIPAVQTPDTTQTVSEPKEVVKVRELKKSIIVDKNATHSCEPELFQLDITGQKTISIRLFLDKGKIDRESLEIGGLPKGIDVTFESNHDYMYSLGSGETTINIIIENQLGSQKGNFSVPIIYTVGSAAVVCQLNILNFAQSN